MRNFLSRLDCYTLIYDYLEGNVNLFNIDENHDGVVEEGFGLKAFCKIAGRHLAK